MDTFFALQTLSKCNFWASWLKDRLCTSFESPKRGKIDSLFENRGRRWKNMADPTQGASIELVKMLLGTLGHTAYGGV